MIKFLDLKHVNQPYRDELKQAFSDFLDSGYYILGKQVSKFEKDFAEYCGSKYCVGVSNGLDALTLIFKSYQVIGKLKKGDEVIVVANTYIASILSIINSGLKPVLVEPDLDTFNIDPKEIEKKLSNKTKVVLVVHLYGQLCDMKSVDEIAQKNNLLVVEDAAQAHGAKNTNDIKAGNLADAAAFSFYPTKNLGALGDAGAITTNHLLLAKTVQKLRNYGRISNFEYELTGHNCRLDEIQAAFLSIKLKDLDKINSIRRSIAIKYISNINNTCIKLPYYNESLNHVFYQFVVLVENRKHFIDYMRNNQVELGIHYPTAPHNQRALKDLIRDRFPVTELIHEKCVSLPINESLQTIEVDKIIYLANNYKE